jgi:hypothetical protein
MFDGADFQEDASGQLSAHPLKTMVANNLASEASTARAAELANANDIAAEATRAGLAEVANADAIAAEATRAGAAESANTALIGAEASTARAAELANANAIAAEVTRAGLAEVANADSIVAEATRAGLAESANAADISTNAADIAGLTTAHAVHEGMFDARKFEALLGAGDVDKSLVSINEMAISFDHGDPAIEGFYGRRRQLFRNGMLMVHVPGPGASKLPDVAAVRGAGFTDLAQFLALGGDYVLAMDGTVVFPVDDPAISGEYVVLHF